MLNNIHAAYGASASENVFAVQGDFAHRRTIVTQIVKGALRIASDKAPVFVLYGYQRRHTPILP